MGYCFITGEKKNGRWKFLKCDGRKNLDHCKNGGGDPLIERKSGLSRGYECVTYSATYTEAKKELIEWFKQHPEQMEEELDGGN